MTQREIINKVFDQYFHSNYLPSAYGGFPGSTLVQLLSAISTIHEKIESDADLDKVWYKDKTVTYYTPKLHKLIQLPRFVDDSDQDFLNRIASFQTAQEFGGQSEESIRTVLLELMKAAIQSSDIAFILTGDTADPWDGTMFWDGTATWQDLTTILDVDFLVSIRFTRSGNNTDTFAWEYWNLPGNFTKIDDLILLFKPVGATFKIQLVAPPSFRRYATSQTRIKTLDAETTQTSSTTLKVPAYDDKAMASDTAIQHLGYFYGDLESFQTVSITSATNITDTYPNPGGNWFIETHTKLYGSRTTIIAP